MITDDDIEVYDDTLSLDSCIKLIKLFTLYHDGGIDKMHGYFERQFDNNASLKDRYNNPFEYLIDDYLTKMGDKSKFVEYWYRPRWRNMPCHQDLNEYLVKEYGRVINPNKGHIVYLSGTANHTSTIIFNRDMSAVTTISPKVGRVVRFDGLCHHAVPRPFERIYEKQRETPVDTDVPGPFRHVLLFNTWDSYIPSPHESLVKGNIVNPVSFKSTEEWIKLPLFDEVKIREETGREETVMIEMMYMGNAERRFGFNKFGKFKISSRFRDDGYSRQMLAYEVEMDEESHRTK